LKQQQAERTQEQMEILGSSKRREIAEALTGLLARGPI
jgi:hypothetical protein